MKKQFNSNFKEDSIDAVVLAGKSKLIVKDKPNIIYFSSPLYSPYSFASYPIEIINFPEPINKASIDYKAIIKINNKPMVTYVTEALAESDYVNNIYIVGERDKLNQINFSREKKKIKFVDDKGSFVDNLIEGGNASQSNKILFSTSDIPLIKKEHINNFIEKCFEREDGSIYVSYYTKESNHYNLKANYPARIGEQHLRNGGIFILNRDLLNEISKKEEIYEVISTLYGKRKKGLWPYLKLVVNYIPINVLTKYIINNFTIKHAEEAISNKLTKRINKKTGNNLTCNLYGIETVPEVGTDIDSYEDLQNIEKFIIKRLQN